MSMSMNVLAVLVSLAMMLTGASGAEQPALMAKTLTVSDVAVTINGETVALSPSASLSVQTDGERALYDFAVNLDGERLFPVQLAADSDALSVLLERSDFAVALPAEAINAAISAEAGGYAEMDPEAQAMMDVLMNDYIPAYTALIQAVGDPEFRAQMEEVSNAVYAEKIDRGEGTPAKAEVDGVEYDVTAYSYTIESDQMVGVIDALYTSNEVMSDFYNALFKLYGTMPEESGLKGITSIADLYEKIGMTMSAQVEEKISEADGVEIMDVVLTLEIDGSVIQQMAENGGEADESTSEQPLTIEPFVFNVHSTKVGEAAHATMDCDYAVEDVQLKMECQSYQEGEAMSLIMNMAMTQEDETANLSLHIASEPDAASGDVEKVLSLVVELPESVGGSVVFDWSSVSHQDGTSEGSFDVKASVETDVEISFKTAVTLDAVEDKLDGHEVIEISDLSEEGMNALMQDQTLLGSVMQVAGTFSEDAGKLMADESVARLVQLFTPVVEATEVVADDFAMDGGDEAGEAEGTRTLPFNVPQFTYLPEGWSVRETEVDTEYDNVSVTLSGASDFDSGYAYFYANDSGDASYTVGEDGSIEPATGRVVRISNSSSGSWWVEMNENGVNASISLYSEGIDLETIGKIVAGIQF